MFSLSLAKKQTKQERKAEALAEVQAILDDRDSFAKKLARAFRFAGVPKTTRAVTQHIYEASSLPSRQDSWGKDDIPQS